MHYLSIPCIALRTKSILLWFSSFITTSPINCELATQNGMTILRVEDISVAFTSFFMKLIGFWLAANRNEQRLRNVTLLYTMWAIVFAMWVVTTDFYHSTDNFEDILYCTCNVLSIIIPMFKLLVLLTHRRKFLNLITYLQRKFLHSDYDDFEASILASCKRKCTFFICVLSSFCNVTVIAYIATPIFVNIGKNESDRILPFDLWIGLPVSMTPYFEIFFTLQTLSLYHVGVTYFCFDNCLCLINLHLAGQFKILQYRFSKKCVAQNQSLEKNPIQFANDSCGIFKGYIRQHQILITYCSQLEEIFNLIVLAQVITFSLFICLDGYQMLLAGALNRQIIFFFHLVATVSQLLMFAYSCDCIIQESIKLAPAIYAGPWLHLPATESVRKMKEDVVMIIMRSYSPCGLSASGFFVVSLETFTKVLTTAASYFTLLKQSQDVTSL